MDSASPPIPSQLPLLKLISPYLTTQTLITLLVSFLLLCLTTRILSGRNTNPKTLNLDGSRTVPRVPYWIPFLGHIPNMAWDADSFVRDLRGAYTKGIFSLNFGGAVHHVTYTPGLATALLGQKPSVAESDAIGKRIMMNVFGFPRAESEKYEHLVAELQGLYQLLLSEPSLGNLVARTAGSLKGNVKDFVTGNDSLVDQMLWERSSQANLAKNIDGQPPVVEASLLHLVRDFVAHTANPSFMGSAFLANFPDYFDDIWNLDRGFLLLTARLPRWLPIPSLTRAHLARRRLLQTMETFHNAMEDEANGQDPGPKWRELDDVGTLVKARMPIYRKYDMSLTARASIENLLMWAANANSDMLIFWMINRIYADKALLEMIREEIAPYISATQPASEFTFVEEAPQFETFDVEALCANCPLLKSCYVECLRLDTASWSLKTVNQDFVLRAREKDAQGWLLRKGDCVHAAHDLHNTNPEYWADPLAFKADRHIKHEGEGERKRGTADLGSIRPYGGGSSMCKGRAFAFKECMMFTAAIVAMWDIEAAGGTAEWQMPRHARATGVYSTKDSTRVWIKRRKLPRAGGI